MFERLEFAISDLERRQRTLLQYGIITDLDSSQQAKVKLGEKSTTDWLPILSVGSDVFSPLQKGDQVAILNQQLILGVVRKSSDLVGKGKETLFRRKDGKIIINTDKISINREGSELVSLIVKALESIASSKTATFNGPQPLMTASSDLLEIKNKIEGFIDA